MSNHHTRDWLGEDWLKLKGQLVTFCVRYVALLYDDDETYSSSLFSQFRDQLLSDLNERTRAGKDVAGLWGEALGLLARIDDFAPVLDKELGHIKKDISPAKVLGQCFGFFLEEQRRVWYAQELNETSARVKTWERLDRISKSLLRKEMQSQALETANVDLHIDRCTEGHFKKLHQHIREHHRKDYNYPQSLNNIRDFFYLFCKCCRKRANVDLQQDDYYSLSKGGISTLVEKLFNTQSAEVLQQCLHQLNQEQSEILDIEFKLGIHSVIYHSATGYRKDKGMTKHAYDITKQQALRQLGECFENAYPQIGAGVNR